MCDSSIFKTKKKELFYKNLFQSDNIASDKNEDENRDSGCCRGLLRGACQRLGHPHVGVSHQGGKGELAL